MFFFSEVARQFSRRRARTALMLCIAALLMGSLALYQVNILSNESVLEQLGDALPVTVTVSNNNGSRQLGLQIDTEHFDAFMKADLRDAAYSAAAMGAYDPAYRVEPFVMGDAPINGINTVHAVSALENGTVTFAEGADDGIFAGSEAVCVVYDRFAATHGLSVGDSVTMPVYVMRHAEFTPDGFNYVPIGEQTLQVVGTYSPSATSGGQPPMFFVPVAWLRETVDRAGEEFYYATLSGTLNHPEDMNEIKVELARDGFLPVIEGGIPQVKGVTLLFDDQIFIKTAEQIHSTLRIFYGFQAPFYILVILLECLSTVLILRGCRQEMAIASSLGESRARIVAVYFCAVFLTNVVGVLLVLPAMGLAASLSAAQILKTAGIFLLCTAAGSLAALAGLLRFDTVTLLTKVD